jgi:tripartite ATP-independent transporter DctM subunit
MDHQILGIIGLGFLLVAIFIGFPIAFTLGAISIVMGFIALGPVVFDLAILQTLSVMQDSVLASIPFFLFMGFLLEQSGIMERLFGAIQQLFAGVRGSLYLAVIVTATIFAAATGIVGSSVVLLGVMAAPSMIKSGYDVRMSAGAITAGGTLGILIPPSVMLIVMGPVVGIPATDLFAAAVFPGLLLAFLFASWCMIRCWINPALGPALPVEMRAKSLKPVLIDLAIGIAPVIVVLFATLGVILAGIATPTDAGAVGCVATFLLTVMSGRMTFVKIKNCIMQTLKVSSMILLLVTTSNLFGAVFSRLGSSDLIAGL